MLSKDFQLIQDVYSHMAQKHALARQHFSRALTLAEKILVAHLNKIEDEDGKALVRKKSYANLFPDRVAMQDATAQMALLQFISAHQPQSAVPTTVHCDHLIEAHTGASKDLPMAMSHNKEVYDFLQSASQKYGIGFWKPGSGIIHQVVLENYAFPGGMMVGTDSHTPNAGGLGMIAIGVGGADAVDVMTGQGLNIRWPGVIGVKLTGKLQGWASPKDVILKLMGILTVKGGTGHIVEFFGDGCESISATGKGTIANMGAEHGATTSVFPLDAAMISYLEATDRSAVAKLAQAHATELRADQEVYDNPEKFYDRVVHIDLSTLEPHIVGPHTPDLSRPISAMKVAIAQEQYPDTLKAALVGSCTNSSYEDIGRAASLARAAAQKGFRAKIPFYVTPGSETVHTTIKRDGFMQDLESIGAIVLANACGPCIGQWKRDDVKKGETNSIISSYNRNFPGRNDGSRDTLSFLASPEVVTAAALAGTLSFNPLTDTLTSNTGEPFKLPIPKGDALPRQNFQIDKAGFLPPAEDGSHITLVVDKASERLALLEPFTAMNPKTFLDMPVLLKAKGKCTTDHISAAGPWLNFRGHLDKIADNTYIGAINAFTNEAGKGINVLEPSAPDESYPSIARSYKAKGISWVVIGDENFGEGSSREHAAMQPRHLGGKAIIVRSFARIHESNLKKHGMLPLTFQNPADYDKIQATDRLSILDIETLSPGKSVDVLIKHADGTQEKITCLHSFSDEQIIWFEAGSALNALHHKRG